MKKFLILISLIFIISGCANSDNIKPDGSTANTAQENNNTNNNHNGEYIAGSILGTLLGSIF